MQTFLPYGDFDRSAQVLDYRRLGKQRVEALQIINVLEGRSTGWKRHPAVRMWEGYVDGLKSYLRSMITEWVRRGYVNNIVIPSYGLPTIQPPWLGDEHFHSSHRAALLHKNWDYYSQFGWVEEPKLDYYWPGDRNGQKP
jgi:Pyrimidine dimer DNA glycosylase